MDGLTLKEIELAAIGAAIGSNCVPCVEYHIKEAKRVGLTNNQYFKQCKWLKK